MATRLTNFRELGDRVARTQDAIVGHGSAAADARALWMAFGGVGKARPAASRRRLWAVCVAAIAAVGLLALVLVVHPPVAFEVGPSASAAPGTRPVRGVVGEWIAAPWKAALPLRFSDGSLVVLNAASRARVANVASVGASVVLENGSADARIVHRTGTRWGVQAGPFNVRVVGTAFVVTWDPASELFTLVLNEGEVTVSGCSLSAARVVAAHETFRATCHDGHIASSAAAALPPVSPEADDALPGPTAAALPPDSGSPGPVDAPPPDEIQALRPPPPIPWQEWMVRHEYTRATDVAEAEGLTGICAKGDIAELMALADAARFAKRRGTAEFVWRRVRERFPQDERASLAAFQLGRMAFDDRASYLEAAQWFRTYLTERPGGPLGREALGRMIEALDRHGDREGAKQAAARYLQTFPSGPHAELARNVVAR